MRLAECLNQSDFHNLRKIAQRHALTCPLYSKNALLQELLARFFEPDYVEARVSSLSSEANAVLQEIALDGRNRYAKEELLVLLRRFVDIQANDDHIDKNDTTVLLEELLQEGLIFEVGALSSRAYVCPEDLWKRIQTITSRQLRQSIQEATITPTVYRSDGTAVARDAATFLLFAARQELKLTQEGVIFKRQQTQVLELFEVHEEVLSHNVGWRFGFGRRYHDYPDRLALLYDHLYEEGCLCEQSEGTLTVVADTCATYLKQSEEARGKKIFEFWLRSYRNPIHSLRRMLGRLAELTAHSWVYGDSLKSALIGQIRPYYYESAEQVYEQHILKMLVHLGALMKGQGDSGVTLYQLSLQGVRWIQGKAGTEHDESILDVDEEQERESLAVIQPTFEILVPASGDATYGWDLQIVADLVKNDCWRTYFISRDSVYRALLAGWDKQRILSFLARISVFPVPGNVERTVAQWCDEYGRVKLELCCLVTANDEATARELKEIVPLRDRMRSTPEGRMIVFAFHDEELVLSVLRRLGYLVQVVDVEKPIL